MGDIFEHAVKPTEYDLLAVPNTAFLPKALERAAKNATAVEDRRKKSRLSRRERRRPCSITGAWRKLNDCDSAIAAKKTCRGDKVLDGRHFYQRQPRRGDDEFLTAVKVGRADLDASSLKCSILFMASCSSHVHFYEALKARRTAASSTCKFFLTAEVCSSAHARTFIKSVFAGNDPMTTRGAKKILKALNGEFDSGIVGVY
jgi:hypothetical protein